MAAKYLTIYFTPTFLILLMLSCIIESEKENAAVDVLEYDVPASITKDSPSDFFGRSIEYLEWEAENSLSLAEEILLHFPPEVKENIVRRASFQILDLVFHDPEAPNRAVVQNFHHRRFALALDEIQNTKMKKGAMIWKLYNMGFVIRTPTVTFCFDLVRGHSAETDGFSVPHEMMSFLIDQCDALFISHKHRDHADQWVAQTFIDQGKPVVAPPEVWEEEPVQKQITHLERAAHEVQALPLQSGQQKLNVVIYPGHQGTIIQNNMTLVITPEGLSFVHTGDQSHDEDFEWIDKVDENNNVDVYLPNTWTTDPRRAARGYNPMLIIPSHENELAHVIAHREAYILNYQCWNVSYPKLMMAWGESYHYLSEIIAGQTQNSINKPQAR